MCEAREPHIPIVSPQPSSAFLDSLQTFHLNTSDIAYVRKNRTTLQCMVLINGRRSQINVLVFFLFVSTENVAEENLFYIVSPKDLVLAKVCPCDPFRYTWLHTVASSFLNLQWWFKEIPFVGAVTVTQTYSLVS